MARWCLSNSSFARLALTLLQKDTNCRGVQSKFVKEKNAGRKETLFMFLTFTSVVANGILILSIVLEMNYLILLDTQKLNKLNNLDTQLEQPWWHAETIHSLMNLGGTSGNQFPNGGTWGWGKNRPLTFDAALDIIFQTTLKNDLTEKNPVKAAIDIWGVNKLGEEKRPWAPSLSAINGIRRIAWL